MMYAKLLGLGLLTLSLATLGCTPQTGKKTAAEKPKTTPAKDDHVHAKGPNGGVVFDFGKHHAELTVDHGKKECTILVLGEDEKTPVAVAAENLTVNIKATKTKEGKAVPAMAVKMLPQDGKDGKAFKYVGADPALENVANLEGTVIGKVDGQPAEGEFKE